MGKKREEKEEEKKKKGRRACCEREGVRKGAWTVEEDKILVDFITQNGHGTWRNLPKLAGLLRCGKSCRLRWTNYLRPDIKRGPFTAQEENTIIQLHSVLGNKWAAIASHLAGRTDNDVKNFWNSHLRKRAMSQPSNSVDEKLDTESKGDYFLRLWNSGVGESFRGINESTNENSQTSSLTKVGIDDQKVGVLKDQEDVAAYSDSSKLNEIDDSSDSMLKLLLDFPVGGNDMGFLEAPHDDVSMYIQD